MRTQYSVQSGDGLTAVSIENAGEGRYRAQVGEHILELDVRPVGPNQYHVLVGQEAHDVVLVPGQNGEPWLVHWDGTAFPVALLDEQQAARAALSNAARAGAPGGDGAVAIRAPMPGKVVKRLVGAGQVVTAGQGVIVIEAMKMENELRTPVNGSVKEVRVGEGENVEAGEALVLVE